MKQLTVKDLFGKLSSLMLAGKGSNLVVIGDDEECNAFHGVYDVVSNEEDVKYFIESSCGVSESQSTDPSKIIIIM